MTSPHVKRMIDHLWWLDEEKEPPRVYALLDAARDESIYPKIVNSDLESTCLYQGEKARELAWVAPYLVLLRRDDPFTQWVVENGWGKSWGVFAGSSATLNELKRHFRTFLMVYDEEGNSLYFRYYDPRVFRVYLPTCNAEELGNVFGPIEYFLLEQEDQGSVSRFRNVSGVLQQEKLRIAPG
jgi:hypothetical protein